MTFPSSAGPRGPGAAERGSFGPNAHTYRTSAGWRIFLGVAAAGFGTTAVASWILLRHEPDLGWILAPVIFGFFA